MITTIRDGRKVYHWPASIRQLVLAHESARASDGGESYTLDQNSTKQRIAFRKLNRQAAQAASDWQLCACGSLCRAIPRVEEEEESDGRVRGVEIIPHMFEPKDRPLRKLGLGFMEAIRSANYGLAFVTMEQIEERAAIVLAKLGEVPKKYEAPNKRK